jgi:hypothetical protein
MTRRGLWCGTFGLLGLYLAPQPLHALWWWRVASFTLRILARTGTASRTGMAFGRLSSASRLTVRSPRAVLRPSRMVIPTRSGTPRSGTVSRGKPASLPSRQELERLVKESSRGYNRKAFKDEELHKVAGNLVDVLDFLQSAQDTTEFTSRWELDEQHDIEANRAHLEGCSSCADTYLALTDGVETIYLPPEIAYQLAYDEYMTVRSEETRRERQRRANRRSQVVP